MYPGQLAKFSLPPPVGAGTSVAGTAVAPVVPGAPVAWAPVVGAADLPGVPQAARKAANPAIALPARKCRRLISVLMAASIRSVMAGLLFAVRRPRRARGGARRSSSRRHPRR